MRKKLLMAFALGLTLTLAPASVLAAGNTTVTEAVVKTLTGEGEEKTDAELTDESETVDTAATDAKDKAGWSTVTTDEGSKEKIYMVETDGELVKASGLTEIEGTTYYFDEETGYLKAQAVVSVEKDDKTVLLCFDEDGKLVAEDGWFTAEEKSYYVKDGEVLCGNSTKYVQKETGRNIAWLAIGKDWYLVDRDEGYRLSGFQEAGNWVYYMDPAKNDVMATGDKNGWLQVDGAWYDLMSFGAIRNTGWATIDKWTYYFHKDGKMEAGPMAEIDGTYYGFTSWGAKMTNSFYTAEDGTRYYFTANGSAAKNAWVQDKDGTWYWYGEDCKVMTDQWLLYNGSWYYFHEDGKMYANEWLYYKNEWYFFKSWGAMYASEWANYNGSYYYFKSWGPMYHDCWLSIGGYDYYFRSWGARCQNMGMTIDGKNYVFDANGRKVTTGYYYANGYRYYRLADGSNCLDLVTVDPNYVKTCAKYITVDRTNGRVTVYGYNNGKYDTPIKSMYCSVGNPISLTTAGDFNTGWKRTVKEMNASDGSYRCWAAYVTQITGPIYFHAVASNTPELNYISAAAFNALGTPQSHGCVRLAACEAKWMYQYVKGGTRVHVANAQPLPLGAVRYKWTGPSIGSDPTWTPLTSSDFVAK